MNNWTCLTRTWTTFKPEVAAPCVGHGSTSSCLFLDRTWRQSCKTSPVNPILIYPPAQETPKVGNCATTFVDVYHMAGSVFSMWGHQWPCWRAETVMQSHALAEHSLKTINQTKQTTHPSRGRGVDVSNICSIGPEICCASSTKHCRTLG